MSRQGTSSGFAANVRGYDLKYLEVQKWVEFVVRRKCQKRPKRSMYAGGQNEMSRRAYGSRRSPSLAHVAGRHAMQANQPKIEHLASEVEEGNEIKRKRLISYITT